MHASAAVLAHRRLREGTRDAHETTEASSGMRRLMDGQMDESGYLALLEAQWGLFRSWESERSGWLRGIAEQWVYASRTVSLEADLHHGRSSPVTDTAPPAPFGADEPSTDATYWGELYVIEGSTLGSRLIVKRLRDRFPALPHHYYAMGENTSSPWPRFQSVLDHALPDESTQHQAIVGARRMFAHFQQTLRDPAAHD